MIVLTEVKTSLHLHAWLSLNSAEMSFLQVSVEFADLHDTPGRMQEKGVISVSIFVLQF